MEVSLFMNNYFLCVLILFCFIVAFFSILSSINQFESYAQVESSISYFYLDSFLFVPVDSIFDQNRGFDELNGAFDVTTFTIRDSTFALVTAFDDNGIQVIDITNPTNIIPGDSVTNNQRGFNTLVAPRGITSAIIDSKNYALVTASGIPGGIQVINMTDPANLTPADSVTDGKRGFDMLDGAFDVTTVKIGSDTFALVTSSFDKGIQVINMTDPANLTPADSVTHGKDGFVLEKPSGITTVTIDGSTFALVTSSLANKIQIIDISDPTNIIPGDSVTDGLGGFNVLDGASGITTVKIGDSTFALIASQYDDGIQVINMTDPTNLIPVDSVTDGNEGFDELEGAYDITTVEIGSDIFALVASTDDDGIQVINMTNPANLTPVYSVTDGNEGFDELEGVRGITTVKIEDSTFALAVSGIDAGIQVIDISKREHFIDLSDSLSISDSGKTSVNRVVNLSDSLSIIDSIQNAKAAFVQEPKIYDVHLDDSLGISDTIQITKIEPILVTITLFSGTDTLPRLDVMFAKPVTGFELSEIIIKNADKIDFEGEGDSYSVWIVPTSNTVTITIPAGSARTSDDIPNKETTATFVFERKHSIELSDSLAIADSVEITKVAFIPESKTYNVDLVDSLAISDSIKQIKTEPTPEITPESIPEQTPNNIGNTPPPPPPSL